MNLTGRYVAMVIFIIGTYGVNSLILDWCGSVCAQTKEKKVMAISIFTSIMSAFAGFSMGTAAMGWDCQMDNPETKTEVGTAG
ncbi:hypothetical protein SUNI508_12035 [Seiridium unicorne]|uniref:Uncharacterized protein n=1 Tax=Seiridium unicorne TaxID=138068 RepID=A0ABR2UEU3_9PEZI